MPSRRRRCVLAAVSGLALLPVVACASAPAAPEPLLQPQDLQGLSVDDAVPDAFPPGALEDCPGERDPHLDLSGSAGTWNYYIDLEEGGREGLTTAVHAPDADVLDAVLDYAARCSGPPEVMTDEDAAREVARAAELPDDAVTVYRSGDTGWPRAYAVVGTDLVLVEVGPRLVPEVDLVELMASAVSRVRDSSE